MTRNPDNPRLRHFQQSFHTVHTTWVVKEKQDLWDASESECLCSPESQGGNSQGTDPSKDCPYVRMNDEGGEIHNVNHLCRNIECRICSLMDNCELTSHVELGVRKNASLMAKLKISKHIAHLLNSVEIDADRVAAITEALCVLLSCKQTNLANTGFLTMLCPYLECLQLQRGWGALWFNLSKISSAVSHHEGRRNQLAALLFVRKKCILAPESNWHFYLQTEDKEEEREITNSVFAGCFNEH